MAFNKIGMDMAVRTFGEFTSGLFKKITSKVALKKSTADL